MQLSVRMELYGKCMTSIFGQPGNLFGQRRTTFQVISHAINIDLFLWIRQILAIGNGRWGLAL